MTDVRRPADPLHAGDPRRLGGYRLTGRLGSGGMGVVYLGHDDDGRQVAVKLVHTGLAEDDEFRRRFRSEVTRARQVPPFCTAEVLGADLDHEPPYLVVEYVDGPSLAEVVEQRGPLSPANLHSLAIGVATALTAIHGAGVIHRDLKPRNVLLAPGSPKVIDFGIARALEATSQHTHQDQMVGTVAYMAPERFQAAPGTALTPAADIFAWGVVVGYAGTGRTPFHGDSPPATAGRILTQPPHLDGLSEPLRSLVELTLAKDPASRPTARELLDLLLAGASAHAPRRRRAPRHASAPHRTADEPTSAGPRPAELPGRPRRTPFAVPRLRRSTVTAPRRPVAPRSPDAPVAHGRPSLLHRVVAWQWGTLVTATLLLAAVVSASVLFGLAVRGSGVPADAAPRADGTFSAPRPAGSSAPAGLDPAAPDGTDPDRTLTGSVLSGTGPGLPLGGSATAPGAGPFASLRGGHVPSRSLPVEPPGVAVVQDPLNAPGLWRDSEDPQGRASCLTGGTMRVSRADRGIYRCAGPTRVLTGAHSVAVNTTLETPGSCAAIWFSFTAERGGQVLRICQDRLVVAVDRQDDRRVLGELPLATPIAPASTTRIRLAVADRSAQVFRDGAYLGTVPLPAPPAGQVVLGLSVDTVTDPAPYAVTFANVDIRATAAVAGRP